MTRLLLFIKYLLVILVVAVLGVVAALAYYDFKYFQPTLKNYALAVALPESLPRLLDAESGDTMKYSVARIMLDDSGSTGRSHIRSYIWGNFVDLHLTKREQHAVFASRAYLGVGVHGFFTASNTFYKKKLSQITVRQMALLVARLRSPLSCQLNPPSWRLRADDLLLRAGYADSKS